MIIIWDHIENDQEKRNKKDIFQWIEAELELPTR